jgi:hypothetical protein
MDKSGESVIIMKISASGPFRVIRGLQVFGYFSVIDQERGYPIGECTTRFSPSLCLFKKALHLQRTMRLIRFQKCLIGIVKVPFIFPIFYHIPAGKYLEDQIVRGNRGITLFCLVRLLLSE